MTVCTYKRILYSWFKERLKLHSIDSRKVFRLFAWPDRFNRVKLRSQKDISQETLYFSWRPRYRTSCARGSPRSSRWVKLRRFFRMLSRSIVWLFQVTPFLNAKEYLKQFFDSMDFELFETPNKIQQEKYPQIRDAKDLPILVSAILSDADIVLTGDKDFSDINMAKPLIFTPNHYFDLIDIFWAHIRNNGCKIAQNRGIKKCRFHGMRLKREPLHS